MPCCLYLVIKSFPTQSSIDLRKLHPTIADPRSKQRDRKVVPNEYSVKEFTFKIYKILIFFKGLKYA